LYVYWTTDRDVKTEIVDARSVRFTHVDLNVIAKSLQVEKVLEIVNVPANHTGVYFRDGNFVETLPPGRYAFWKNMADVKVVTVGIRDVILPGEMKDLLNKVTEAKKAAEANLIVRREETAAMRSQANTAKLLQDNPTLMRLRELEVLEKVAATAKLNIVLGDKGLTERIVNVL